MRTEQIVEKAMAKGRKSKCEPMPEQWETAAKELLARSQRMLEGIKIVHVYKGVEYPHEPMTLEQCRWAVHDLMKAGGQLRPS